MGKRVICLGGAGNAAVIGAAIKDANRRGLGEWMFAGFLNDQLEAGSTLDGAPVFGPLALASELAAEGYYFINAILRIDGNRRRIALIEGLGIPDERLATFVHPTAYVAPGVELGPGCAIMPHVSISPEVRFGKGCCVFQGATIGHDNVIGAYSHITAQACVGSYLRLGRGVHIGLNSSVREHVTIGDYSTLGMASMLLTDIGDEEVWAGSPARFLRKTREDE